MKSVIQTLFLFLLVTQICFAQGSWAPIGDMPEIRLAHTADELNGKIYIVGGYNSEPVPLPTTALVYEISLGTWTQIALPNNEFKVFHTSCVVDGKLYAIGGWEENPNNFGRMERYDPLTETWDTTLAQPTPRGNLTCASIDGKIYAIGGMTYSGYTGLKTLEVYDVSTDTWTQLADMPTGRWGPRAIAFNGKIYVLGGTTGLATTVYASVEVYDPQNNTWTTKSGLMPTPRYQLTTCLLDGNIYAIGGWYNSGSGPIYDKVEVYNPGSDTWNTETPMPVARALLASILLDGKIRVFGGSSTTHPMTGTSGIYEFSNNDPLSSGTYTIGTGGYFTTIQNAFDKLETDGVAGNVTFELIDDLYTAPSGQYGFLLNGPIPGAGPNNRVTIKPAANHNVTVQGNNLGLLNLINTSYITFDGVGVTGSTTLTINALQNASYVYNDALDFNNNSDHNIIQNITFIVDDYLRPSAGIWFSGSAPDSNLIQYNAVKKAGIFLSITTGGNGNIIRGNQIGSETDSLVAYGIEVVDCEGTLIENNIIQNMKVTVSGSNQAQVGIALDGGNNQIIRNNVIRNCRSISGYVTAGIYAGVGGTNNQIYNNMVYGIHSTSIQSNSRLAGIYIAYQTNPKIYYNSVYLLGSGATPLGSAALYIYTSSTNVDAKNNIFINTRDESPYYASAIYDYEASNLTSDYNNLYSNNYLVRIGNTNYNTLTDWQATGKDLNSISEMPNFVEPYLHIDGSIATLLDNGATPILGIDTDFDGETRNATTPDIGADEFTIVGVEEEETIPNEFALEQNYPNPFNPSTKISWQSPVGSQQTLKIYDILGNEVATLVDEYRSAGRYEIELNASALPSGVYFYQLKAGEFISTKKMILMK